MQRRQRRRRCLAQFSAAFCSSLSLLGVDWNTAITKRSSPVRITGRVENPAARSGCWVDLNSQRFDAVAEASELPDHSRSAYSRQPFAHELTAFFVADPSVQNYPDQPTKAISNCPDGLIVSQA
jgi:hypothetical protein